MRNAGLVIRSVNCPRFRLNGALVQSVGTICGVTPEVPSTGAAVAVPVWPLALCQPGTSASAPGASAPPLFGAMFRRRNTAGGTTVPASGAAKPVSAVWLLGQQGTARWWAGQHRPFGSRRNSVVRAFGGSTARYAEDSTVPNFETATLRSS
jgi:hypothetical protein